MSAGDFGLVAISLWAWLWLSDLKRGRSFLRGDVASWQRDALS
jgi:hypothetical protein